MARKLNQLGGFGFGSNPAARKAVDSLRPKKPRKPKVTYAPQTPQARPVNPPAQPIPGSTDWLGQFNRSYGSAPQGVGQKQRQAYYGSPVYQGSSTTNRQLDQLVKSAAQTQFGPAQTQLNQLYSQSAGMEQKIPQWFNDYRAVVQDLAARDQAASQAAVAGITGLGGTLANAAAQAASQDQQAMQADAAIRGATVDPAGITRATQAAALNTQALADQAALQTQLGFNTGANWRNQELVGEQAKIQNLQAELAYRRNELDPQALQLTRDLGAFANTYRDDRLSKIIEQTQNQQAIDWATRKDKLDLKLDAQKAAQSAASDRANRRIKQQQIRIQRQQQQIENQQRRRQLDISQQNADANTTRANRPPSSTGKDSFGNTPKARRSANDAFTKASSLADLYHKGGTKADGTKIKGASESEIYQLLLSENTNAVIARAAAQMVSRGYVTPQLARKLRARGVTQGYSTKKPHQVQIPVEIPVVGGITLGG